MDVTTHAAVGVFAVLGSPSSSSFRASWPAPFFLWDWS